MRLTPTSDLRDLNARETELELAISDEGVVFEITYEWIAEIYHKIAETINSGSRPRRRPSPSGRSSTLRSTAKSLTPSPVFPPRGSYCGNFGGPGYTQLQHM